MAITGGLSASESGKIVELKKKLKTDFPGEKDKLLAIPVIKRRVLKANAQNRKYGRNSHKSRGN